MSPLWGFGSTMYSLPLGFTPGAIILSALRALLRYWLRRPLHHYLIPLPLYCIKGGKIHFSITSLPFGLRLF
ncbi:MAG TPA: hypothetical protein VF609_17170, partial [Flavisolibacter sp.]